MLILCSFTPMQMWSLCPRYHLYNYDTSMPRSFHFAQAQVVRETPLLNLYTLLCSIKQERTATKEGRYKKAAAKAAACYLEKLNSISDAAPEILCNDMQVVKCHLKWLSLTVYVSFPSVWFEVLDLAVRFACMTCKNTSYL